MNRREIEPNGIERYTLMELLRTLRHVQRAYLLSRIASSRNRECEFIRAPRVTRRSVPVAPIVTRD